MRNETMRSVDGCGAGSAGRTRSSHPWALDRRHLWRLTVRPADPAPPPSTERIVSLRMRGQLANHANRRIKRGANVSTKRRTRTGNSFNRRGGHATKAEMNVVCAGPSRAWTARDERQGWLFCVSGAHNIRLRPISFARGVRWHLRYGEAASLPRPNWRANTANSAAGSGFEKR